MHTFTSSTLICLFLFLLISHSEGSERHRRHHDSLRRRPRDFRIHARFDSVLNTGSAPASGLLGTASNTPNYNYTSTSQSPLQTGSAIQTNQDQAKITPASVTRSIYEVCEIPGGTSTRCYPVVETATTSSCSTVLTGFFTRITVSDCDQSVTFSTRSSFEILSTPPPVPQSGLAGRQVPTPSIYIQSMVSYYVAPWQSIAANKPDDIRVVVCSVDSKGTEICTDVQEVWLVRVEVVPVLITSTFTISNFFSEVRTSSSA